MSRVFDTIVVGLGGMGSATLYHLAAAGRRTLGIEQFGIPHEMGSSHGLTRIIRLAYFEHPDYVPLLRRAYELWHALEDEVGETLLIKTGSLDVSAPDDDIFRGSRESCERHGIPHEVLTGPEVSRRFPGYRLGDDMMAVFQGDGGFLLPERCIEAHMAAARGRGATVRSGERVLSWEESGSGVEVVTTGGTYEAETLVITAGAWAGPLTGLASHLVPERQVLIWTHPDQPELYTPDRFPVFNIRSPSGHCYGFPVHGVPGVKVGRFHHRNEVVDPDSVNRDTGPDDEAAIRPFIEAVLPGAAGPTSMMKTCMFTNTPDEHFIIDRLPGRERVVVGAGFSGHGFKFASVVGEVLAGMASGGERPPEARFLSLARLRG